MLHGGGFHRGQFRAIEGRQPRIVAGAREVVRQRRLDLRIERLLGQQGLQQFFCPRILAQFRQFARGLQLELLLEFGIGGLGRVQQNGHRQRLAVMGPVVIHRGAHHSEDFAVLAIDRIHLRRPRGRIVLIEKIHQLIDQFETAPWIFSKRDLPGERQLLHLRQGMRAGSVGNGVERVKRIGLRDHLLQLKRHIQCAVLGIEHADAQFDGRVRGCCRLQQSGCLGFDGCAQIRPERQLQQPAAAFSGWFVAH